MILVTGGTGLVGAHLLYKLVSNGENVRAIYRQKETLKRVEHVFHYFSKDAQSLFTKITWLKADINDIPKLEVSFKNIKHVYHCAALVSFEPHKFDILRKVNIEGTANIVNLCISHSVKKLCYVSSIAAIGHNENTTQLINEQTAWNPEDDNSVYAISKYGAELEAWRATQEGIDVVIINPGIILGAGYWNGGSSGHLFRQIHNGMRYFATGISGYVDVLDVVNAMIKLMNSSIKNQGFILVAENISFNTFQNKVAKELHVTPPKKEAKAWLLNLAWKLDWLKYQVLGTPRALSKQSAKTLVKIAKYDNSKLKLTLNFRFKSIDTSINEICERYLKDLEIP